MKSALYIYVTGYREKLNQFEIRPLSGSFRIFLLFRFSGDRKCKRCAISFSWNLPMIKFINYKPVDFKWKLDERKLPSFLHCVHYTYDLFQPRRLSYSRHTIKEDPRTEKNYKLHMQVRRMMSENKDLRKRQKVQPTGNSSRTDAHEVNLLLLLE